MSGAGRKPGKGARTVTTDEAELWRYATRSLEPVKAKQRVPSVEAPSDIPPRTALTPSRVSSTPAREKAPAPAKGSTRAPARVPKAAPVPLADFDRRKARQIASGKVEVEARVDLHGLRQHDAHMRLRSFLAEAHARGLKTVLVITGKGGQEPADRFGELAGERQRGVLRRSVPQWLGEPELRAIVLSFTPASVRHGGAGALYVQLRKGARS